MANSTFPLLFFHSFFFLLLLLLLLLLVSSSSNPNPNPRRPRSFPQSPRRFAADLIRDLNLLPETPQIYETAEGIGGGGSGGDASSSSSAPRLVERRLRLDILGDAGAEVSVEELGHHAGYYSLEHTHAAK